MKPFSPHSPGDINLEDVVKFSRAGGKLSQGAVKFVGHLPGRSDAYLGVELDKEGGCSCSNGNKWQHLYLFSSYLLKWFGFPYVEIYKYCIIVYCDGNCLFYHLQMENMMGSLKEWDILDGEYFFSLHYTLVYSDWKNLSTCILSSACNVPNMIL